MYCTVKCRVYCTVCTVWLCSGGGGGAMVVVVVVLTAFVRVADVIVVGVL